MKPRMRTIPHLMIRSPVFWFSATVLMVGPCTRDGNCRSAVNGFLSPSTPPQRAECSDTSAPRTFGRIARRGTVIEPLGEHEELRPCRTTALHVSTQLEAIAAPPVNDESSILGEPAIEIVIPELARGSKRRTSGTKGGRIDVEIVAPPPINQKFTAPEAVAAEEKHGYISIAPPDTRSTTAEAMPEKHRRMLKAKSGSSRIDTIVPTSTLEIARPYRAGKAKASKKSLSREDEVRLTNAIRSLRSAIRVRDELAAKLSACGGLSDEVTEAQWADACSLAVMQLRRVMQDGREARSKLVDANVGLVTQIAKRYYHALKKSAGGIGTILTLHDMIQEGNLGILEAAERFEPSKGFRFSTYAAHWIRQRIARAIADYSRVIRLPAHVHSMLRTINRVKKEMEKEIGRAPSMPELADKLGMAEDKLQQYTDSSRTVLSLEASLKGNAIDDKRTLADKIAADSPTPEEDAEFDSLRRDVSAVIGGLGSREREVLVARFGLEDGTPRTVGETAKKMGISRDRVRTLEARALNKLRHPQRNYKLKEYVGRDSTDSPVAEPSPENVWSSYPSPENIWSF